MEQAVGIDINGKELKFQINKSYFITIDCVYKQLTELSIPKGVERIVCYGNKFNRNLILPESIEIVFCDKHQLDNINKYKHLKIIHIHY